MDSSEDHFVCNEDDIIDCASDTETNDMYPDIQMTANDILKNCLGTLILSLKDLSNHLCSSFAFYVVYGLRTVKNRLMICFLYGFWPQDN